MQIEKTVKAEHEEVIDIPVQLKDISEGHQSNQDSKKLAGNCVRNTMGEFPVRIHRTGKNEIKIVTADIEKVQSEAKENIDEVKEIEQTEQKKVTTVEIAVKRYNKCRNTEETVLEIPIKMVRKVILDTAEPPPILESDNSES